MAKRPARRGEAPVSPRRNARHHRRRPSPSLPSPRNVPTHRGAVGDGPRWWRPVSARCVQAPPLGSGATRHPHVARPLGRRPLSRADPSRAARPPSSVRVRPSTSRGAADTFSAPHRRAPTAPRPPPCRTRSHRPWRASGAASWIGSGAVSGSRRKSSTDATDATPDRALLLPTPPPTPRQGGEDRRLDGVLVERVPAACPCTEQLLDHHVSSFSGSCHP